MDQKQRARQPATQKQSVFPESGILKLPDTLLEKASQLRKLPLEEALEILQQPISPDEANAIKTVTTEQSMSTEWLGHCKGRITAPAECGSTPVTCLFTSIIDRSLKYVGI